MIKVLIIEDKNRHFAVLHEILGQDTFRLHFSHDKPDGVEIAGRYPQDVILFHFAGIVDLNLIHLLLAQDLSAPLVIVIPLHPSFEEQRRLMELGIDDYIPEHFLQQSLVSSISSKLTRLSKRVHMEKERLTEFGDMEGGKRRDDHIVVKLGTKLKIVKYADILCITALKEYTRIKTINSLEVLVRKSMRTWSKTLPKAFLRIHRSTIINIEFIENISSIQGGTYRVILKGGKDIFDFSSRYAYLMRKSFPG